MEYTCDDFWERVNKLIKQEHTKQETLAMECGINYQTFRGWIVHKTYPNALQTVLIAEHLNTSVEYLVTGKSDTEETIKAALKEELLKTLTTALDIKK